MMCKQNSSIQHLIVLTILVCCDEYWAAVRSNPSHCACSHQAGVPHILLQSVNAVASIGGVDGDVSQVEAGVNESEEIVGDDSIVIINGGWIPAEPCRCPTTSNSCEVLRCTAWI